MITPLTPLTTDDCTCESRIIIYRFSFFCYFGCVKVGKVFGSVCLAEGDIFRKNADSLRKLCFFSGFRRLSGIFAFSELQARGGAQGGGDGGEYGDDEVQYFLPEFFLHNS